jgi:hypothetical protein
MEIDAVSAVNERPLEVTYSTAPLIPVTTKPLESASPPPSHSRPQNRDLPADSTQMWLA